MDANGLLNKQRFSDMIIDEEITSRYGTTEIKKDLNERFYKSGNRIYKIIDKNYDNPVLLFELPNMLEWKTKENSVTVISGNTIYLYTDEFGFEKILENEELRYNYENIYDFTRE